MAPTAILCGREPKMAQFMMKNLAPKIEVVHVCTTPDAATSEIPALLKGETVTAASGLSTVKEGTEISFIIIGGGYQKDHVEAIKSAADAVKEVPIFWADVSKTAGQGPPTPDSVKDRILECVEKDDKGSGEWAAGIHMF